MLHMGKRLQKRLQELGMRQSDLATKVKRSRQQIFIWTRLAVWQGKTIQLVARAVGVGPEYFFQSGN